MVSLSGLQSSQFEELPDVSHDKPSPMSAPSFYPPSPSMNQDFLPPVTPGNPGFPPPNTMYCSTTIGYQQSNFRTETSKGLFIAFSALQLFFCAAFIGFALTLMGTVLTSMSGIGRVHRILGPIFLALGITLLLVGCICGCSLSKAAKKRMVAAHNQNATGQLGLHRTNYGYDTTGRPINSQGTSLVSLPNVAVVSGAIPSGYAGQTNQFDSRMTAVGPNEAPPPYKEAQ